MNAFVQFDRRDETTTHSGEDGGGEMGNGGSASGVAVLVMVLVQVVVGVCCCRRLRTMIHYTPLHVVTMLYERCVHVCYYSKEWCRWGQD